MTVIDWTRDRARDTARRVARAILREEDPAPGYISVMAGGMSSELAAHIGRQVSMDLQRTVATHGHPRDPAGRREPAESSLQPRFEAQFDHTGRRTRGGGYLLTDDILDTVPRFTRDTPAHHAGEPLAAQVDRLADFILEHVPGEPSRSEGAVDTAIRLLSGVVNPADRAPIRRSALEDTDPELIEVLRRAGDRWGPLGVAVTAAHLTDPNVLMEALRAGDRGPATPHRGPEPDTTPQTDNDDQGDQDEEEAGPVRGPRLEQQADAEVRLLRRLLRRHRHLLAPEIASALLDHHLERRTPQGPISGCECGHLSWGQSWSMHTTDAVLDRLTRPAADLRVLHDAARASNRTDGQPNAAGEFTLRHVTRPDVDLGKGDWWLVILTYPNAEDAPDRLVFDARHWRLEVQGR